MRGSSSGGDASRLSVRQLDRLHQGGDRVVFLDEIRAACLAVVTTEPAEEIG